MHPDGLKHGTAVEEVTGSKAQTLYRLAESADYISQRVLQLDDQILQAEQAVQQMQALVRQLRTLASNTALEATRMKMSGPLVEIARQMRRISQRIGEASEHLTESMRAHSVATGELRQAASTLVVNTKGMLPEAEEREVRQAPPHRPAFGLSRVVGDND